MNTHKLCEQFGDEVSKPFRHSANIKQRACKESCMKRNVLTAPRMCELIRSGMMAIRFLRYPQRRISKRRVTEMAKALRQGAELPPILVDWQTSQIIDGLHRAKAYEKVYGWADALIPVQWVNVM